MPQEERFHYANEVVGLPNLLAEYVSTIDRVPESQRKGQHAFNVAQIVFPTFADSVRGIEGVDPFYFDDNLPRFLDKLAAYYLLELQKNDR